jgi:hypothetical protein
MLELGGSAASCGVAQDGAGLSRPWRRSLVLGAGRELAWELLRLPVVWSGRRPAWELLPLPYVGREGAGGREGDGADGMEAVGREGAGASCCPASLALGQPTVEEEVGVAGGERGRNEGDREVGWGSGGRAAAATVYCGMRSA